MFKIIDDVILCTRGDDGKLIVNIVDEDGTAYEMQDGDTFTLSVRELPVSTSPLLLSCTSETNTIIIPHSQTDSIPAGKYSCDIQLTKQNGEVITVFPDSNGIGKVKNYKNFIVDGEVTC